MLIEMEDLTAKAQNWLRLDKVGRVYASLLPLRYLFLLILERIPRQG